jgi:hypothetical protein
MLTNKTWYYAIAAVNVNGDTSGQESYRSAIVSAQVRRWARTTSLLPTIR